MRNSFVYSTGDIQQVAVLLHENIKLLRVDRSKNRVQFEFENTKELQGILSDYWSGNLLRSANSLFTALKQAKGILYDYHNE